MIFSTNYIKGFCEWNSAVEYDFVENFTDFLTKTLRLTSSRAKSIAKSVYALMSDVSLHYHTPMHVLSIFQWAEQNGIELEDWERMAIWFHDAIYVPGYWGNEEKSSELFMVLAGSEYKCAECVRAGIMATANHTDDADYGAFNKILDLDICNLGWEKQSYRAVSELVRLELEPLYGPEKYAAGRKEFLKKFLSRSSIYRTQNIKDIIEIPARQNLLESIS